MDKKELTKIMIEQARIEISSTKSENILARASVIIGLIEMKGWTISRSKFNDQEYYVLPPHIMKYLIIYVDNPELYSSLVGKIVHAYEKSKFDCTI